MNENNNNTINRRRFFGLMGSGAAVTAASLAGCSSEKQRAVTTLPAEVPTDKMTYRYMPDSDAKVSLLGYGMMRLPEIDKELQEEGKNHLDQEEINRLVDYALAHGVNYFDTSPRYCKGFSEQSVGIALSRHKRSDYIVATKLSNFSPETQSFQASVQMYHDSFKNLQVDYIDYYLLHSIGELENYRQRYIDNGVLDFLVKEREAGRIKYLGWSFHGSKEFFDYMLNEQPVKFDFVQIQMNYKDWKHSDPSAEYMYNELAKRNIPVVIMEPLLGGGLAKVNHKVLAMFQRVDPSLTPAYWAFRFCGHFPKVLTVLSGMTYMEHLQENIRTYSPLQPLSEENLAMLDRAANIIAEFPEIGCTRCQYCMPCPYGLNIPGIFHHYNKCINEGTFADSTQADDYKQNRRAFLIGYDRSVPRLRQADHCVGCEICLPKCPQHISIPQELQKIDKYVEYLKQNPID